MLGLIAFSLCLFGTLALSEIFFYLFQAEKIFKRLRKLEAHYLKGMELYSTVLWHLQKEVELSALAQTLTTFDKKSAEVKVLPILN